jgi:hypothetical protein
VGGAGVSSKVETAVLTEAYIQLLNNETALAVSDLGPW